MWEGFLTKIVEDPCMAKKRNRKKPKYQPEFEFDLSFDDITMVETEGRYERVNDLFKDDIPLNIVIKSPKGATSPALLAPVTEKWNIKTGLTISSQFGEGYFRLDFSYTRNVYIVNYMGSMGDVFYNADISCLSRWCQAYGWLVPQPTEALVTSNVPFWKHMWEVLLIDSPYLDDKYGIRKALDMRYQNDLSGRMEGPNDEETL